MFLLKVCKALPLLVLVSASPILDPRQSPQLTGSSSNLLHQNTTTSIGKWMDQAGINGMVIAMTTPKGDEILSFGQADNTGTAVTDETYWGIASNSKLITALTLAILQKRNTTLANGQAFTLDTPVIDFVEDFKMWDANITEVITTRDFLMHVSGLPSHNFAIAPNLTPSDWLRDLRYLKTVYPLRSQWEYSNVNYVIASAIIEQITNSSFFDAVNDLLFEPLDAGATWNALDARGSQGGRSYGWLRRRRDLELEDCVAHGEGAEYESGICSTQEAFEFWTENEGSELVGAGSALMRGVDMLQWAKSLVNPSPTSTITSNLLTILAEETTEIAPGIGITYGSGEFISPFRGYEAAYHDGGLPGQYSSFYRVTNESMAVFVACNDQTYGAAFAPGIARTVIAELLGLPYVDEISTALPAGMTGGTAKRDIEGNWSQAMSDSVKVRDPVHVGRATPSHTSNVEHLPSRYSPGRPPPADLDGSTYSAPAYGKFTLHPFQISNSTSIEEGAFSLDLFTVELAAMHGDNLRLDGEHYYARWNRSIATHLIFTHWDGPLFNVTPVLVMNRAETTEGSAVNGSQYVGIAYGTGPAVFVDGDEAGVGIFGGFLGAFGYGPGPIVVQEGVKDAADLFFNRI